MLYVLRLGVSVRWPVLFGMLHADTAGGRFGHPTTGLSQRRDNWKRRHHLKSVRRADSETLKLT